MLLMLTLSLLMIMVAVLNIFAGTIPFDTRSSTKKRSVKRDKIPLLVHIHKSGGTTMCQTAQKNGEAVNRDNNCNMKGDGPWTITEKSLFLKQRKTINKNIVIDTYEDHRMAMSFAPLYLKVPIIINNPNVVSKSYKTFWKDLQKIGGKVLIK